MENQLGHVNQYLHNRPDELQAEFDEVAERVLERSRDDAHAGF